jgi:small-conductance mechanosensitive channel
MPKVFDKCLFQLIPVILILLCDSATREAENVVSLCYDLKWHFGTLHRWDERKFYKFTNAVASKVPKFTAMNFFHVTKVTMLNMGWIIANFFVVTIQLVSGSSWHQES